MLSNFNLSYLLTSYVPILNQYTPEELIPLQVSIRHQYLKNPTSQKYFFSTISTTTHPNILYLFPPQYLLFYILHNHHLQDVFINYILSTKLNFYLYKEIPIQKIPIRNEVFNPRYDLKTPMKDFFYESVLNYDASVILNKKIKNILKVVFIIKQFFTLTSQSSLSLNGQNILLSMLSNLSDCAIAQSLKLNKIINKNILSFIKSQKLIPPQEELKNQNTFKYNAVSNLLKKLNYKHLYFYHYNQDKIREYTLQNLLEQSKNDPDSKFENFIKNRFEMTKEEFFQNYKMFLLNQDLYYNYAGEVDLKNNYIIINNII